jgi:hypothetical protein
MMTAMTPTFSYPDKPRRGDAVAVLSPSAGLPARFPGPYELGLRRLREEFGLRPVEYPTTRAAQTSRRSLSTTPASRWCSARTSGTEPQHVIPSGGTVTVDGGTRQIEVTY